MSMPLWRRRRNQSPAPVTPRIPGFTRGTSGEPTSPQLAHDPVPNLVRDLHDAQDEAARWKRHADSYEDEATTATKAFLAKVDALQQAERERDGAYRERAQLLAWLAALHSTSTVITPASDVTDEDGWHLLYLVAGGWQMSWHIHPRDVDLFRHVTVVDRSDARAQWDGHGTEQKYQRIRGHVRLLALDALAADGPSTTATELDMATPCRDDRCPCNGVCHECDETTCDDCQPEASSA